MLHSSGMKTRIYAALLSWFACTFLLAQDPVPLLNDNIGEWTLQNSESSSFLYMGGILRVSGDRGWLRSPREYGDFELRGQVRFVEPDSDSGIFLRVEPGTDFILGWPGDAYQVQMREISVNTGDNPLPLVNLYRHRVQDGETQYARDRVFELYTGVGEWQDFVIRVEGTTLSVELNGELVTEAKDLENLQGYIGFQSEKGVVEFRNLLIHEH
jgi:hypothetical protein